MCPLAIEVFDEHTFTHIRMTTLSAKILKMRTLATCTEAEVLTRELKQSRIDTCIHHEDLSREFILYCGDYRTNHNTSILSRESRGPDIVPF